MNEKFSLAIIGAGPAGIEAGLQAQKKGISYILIEKDSIGALIGNTMSQKKFHQEYGRNTSKLKGDLSFPDRATGAELVRLWQTQTEGFNSLIGARLIDLKKDENMFEIETDKKKIKAERVLLATGTFESPRKLGIPSESNDPRVRYRINYSEDYENKDIVVVGGGNSAVETAVYFANNNRVIMIVRKKELAGSVAENNKEELRELAEKKTITILFESELKELGEGTAKIKTDGDLKDIPCDLLFIHAGFEKPIEFLRSLGISMNESEFGIKPVLNEHLETSLPNLFIAGSLTGADSIIESANQAYDIVHRIAELQK